MLLGWSRAILLQLAHPLMAAAVAAHSSFRGGPAAAASRLRHTVGAMLDLTFGDEAAHARALAGIRVIHNRVNGRLATAVGVFPPGTPYSANDPDLLLWVHVTLLESVVLAHEAVISPIDPADLDAYCEESAPVAISLGARAEDVPRTWPALLARVASVEASGVLCVGADAQMLAHAVLAPPMSGAIWPIAWLNRPFTIGTLPREIRRQYGFDQSPGSAARLRRATRFVRGVRRVTPRVIAQWGRSRSERVAAPQA